MELILASQSPRRRELFSLVGLDYTAITSDADENAEPRVANEPLIASYMNYLVTNHGVIVPQYGDENDQLAVDTLQKIYDEVWGEGVYKCVGVQSEQVVFGGGNIHCITQQEPSA